MSHEDPAPSSPSQRPGFHVGGLALIVLAGLLGSVSSQACGTPWSLWKAGVMLGSVLVLAVWVDQGRLGHRSSGVEHAVIVATGGVVLVAAHSGPVVLALAGAAWGLSKVPRSSVGDAVVWALGAWLTVAATDAAQRGSLGVIAAVAGVSVGAWAAATRCCASAPNLASVSGWGWMLGLLAHAWTAWWWWIDWLPSQAWWALGSLPVWLLAGAGAWVGQGRPGAASGAVGRAVALLHAVAAVVHTALLLAAFAAVAMLR